MIYWIILGVVALLAAMLIFIGCCHYSHKGFRKWVFDNIKTEGSHAIIGVICGVLAFVFVIMSMFVIDAQVSNITNKAEYMAQYDVLNYGVQHMSDDSIDELYKMELYSQVKEYNAEVAGYKAQLENPWTYIFVSPCFDEIPLIQLGGHTE